MTKKLLLYLVFSGYVEDPIKLDFTSCDNINIIGLFPKLPGGISSEVESYG